MIQKSQELFDLDKEFDFGIFISKVNMIYSKVNSAIEKFTKCIEKLEQEDTSQPEIIEDLGTIEIEQSLFDSLVTLGQDLRNEVFYNSLAIAVYSYLDYSITQYCVLLDKYLKCNRRFYKTPGLGIMKCINYLKKCPNISAQEIEEWEDLNNFRRLRNFIAHNSSNTIKNHDKTITRQPDYKHLNPIGSLEITESGHIFIKDIDYIKDMLEKALFFINRIVTQTKDIFS